jgi:hypothetical protein
LFRTVFFDLWLTLVKIENDKGYIITITIFS